MVCSLLSCWTMIINAVRKWCNYRRRLTVQPLSEWQKSSVSQSTRLVCTVQHLLASNCTQVCTGSRTVHRIMQFCLHIFSCTYQASLLSNWYVECVMLTSNSHIFVVFQDMASIKTDDVTYRTRGQSRNWTLCRIKNCKVMIHLLLDGHSALMTSFFGNIFWNFLSLFT